MKANRALRRPPAHPPASAPRAQTSVFRAFLRALEKLESGRAASRPAREEGR